MARVLAVGLLCSASIPARAADKFWSYSDALSKDSKKPGWRFVGPTTVYAFMQAMGLINDHVDSCCMRAKVEKARKQFTTPLG
jgi:DNA-3-methyladenine glycosylase I